MILERYKLILMSFLAVFICYIDRVNISVAIIPMQSQFQWSDAQVGLILGSFYFGYMITMILGGYLADKFGGKKVLGYGLLLWSLFTVLTPSFAYTGFWALIFIRILMGLGEGVTFPSWHSMYARWIPFKERTRAIAITNSGISVGTVFGYVFAAIIISKLSWEWVFYIFGFFGIFWYFFWKNSITSYPEENKKISQKELKLILDEAPSNTKAPKIPLVKLIKNVPFMAISIATFCNNWALYTFLSYLPRFISDPTSNGGLGIDIDSSLFIFLIFIPSIASIFSLILGGYLADHFIKKGKKIIIVRKSVNSLGFFGSAIVLFLIPFQDSISSIMILLCATNFFAGVGAGGFGVNHADLGPKYTGALVGISGSIGMIAAIFSPIIAGIILQVTNSWTLIFNLCSAVLAFGGLSYLFLASAEKQFD